MTLHIFNPEHDLALACNKSNFTAPCAARRLRSALGYLPALWAGDEDVILVEDVVHAEHAFRKILPCVCIDGRPAHNHLPHFVDKKNLRREDITNIDVWGWNMALKSWLLRCGVDEVLLPGDDALSTIRQLSHRRYASVLLDEFDISGIVGKSFLCNDVNEVNDFIHSYQNIVLKAPWSGSGRGVRFISGSMDASTNGWIQNMLKHQGGIMVEPYYNKIKDFGMEFYSDGDGGINYLGLSLFNTVNSSYSGNMLATERVKAECMAHYINMDLLYDIRQTLCDKLGVLYKNNYKGVFGVDMMIIRRKNGELVIHPCVEINLRRTMGHVALAISPSDDKIKKIMQITTYNNYQLKIQSL